MDTGNTQQKSAALLKAAVLPRGYGKHLYRFFVRFGHSGSSPWIRETLLKNCARHRSLRFIPVDTGNTQFQKPSLVLSPVHPRGYGKHSPCCPVNACSDGSSPWIRETRRVQSNRKELVRFIPVDTGNTDYILIRHHNLPVHPRGYGKHADGTVDTGWPGGSSPWIRETQ